MCLEIQGKKRIFDHVMPFSSTCRCLLIQRLIAQSSGDGVKGNLPEIEKQIEQIYQFNFSVFVCLIDNSNTNHAKVE